MTQQDFDYQFLGKGRKAIDGMEKITGHARYAGDVSLPGMLHARPVLSPYAHAKIVSIDTTAARQMPGVVAVLAAGDLSDQGSRDQLTPQRGAGAATRCYFRGQPVVVVVAESEAGRPRRRRRGGDRVRAADAGGGCAGGCRRRRAGDLAERPAQGGHRPDRRARSGRQGDESRRSARPRMCTPRTISRAAMSSRASARPMW